MTDPVAFTEAVHELAPFIGELGITATVVEPERVEATAEWKAERCTAAGTLHGGFLMAVADSVGAMCATLHLPDGAATSTIESKTNFLRAVTSGAVTSITRPLHRGRTIVVLETELTRADGKLAAKVTQSQTFIRP